MKVQITSAKFSQSKQVVIIECEDDLTFAFFLQDIRQRDFLIGWFRKQKSLKEFKGQEITLIRALQGVLHTSTDIPKSYLYPVEVGA